MQGKCTTEPPAEVEDPALPAHLFESNGWPYAKLPAITSGQCVIRIASGFVNLADSSELWLDNIFISAPYLFGRDEAVAPTAAYSPPKTLPRGDDYTEDTFFPAAPGPYDTDYSSSDVPTSAYDDAYGAPAPTQNGTYDALYPAGAYGYSAPTPAEAEPGSQPSRPYEGRDAYPDYQEPDPESDYYVADPQRFQALNGALISAYGVYSSETAPAPASAPLGTKIWLTGVALSGSSSHMRTDGASIYASGASCERCTCACTLLQLCPT